MFSQEWVILLTVLFIPVNLLPTDFYKQCVKKKNHILKADRSKMSSSFHLSWLAALEIVFNNNAYLLLLTLLQAGLLRMGLVIYLFSQTPAGLRICQVAWHPSALF